MPPLSLPPSALAPFGQRWLTTESLSRTPPLSSGELGNLIDAEVGECLAVMLGGIPVSTPTSRQLQPTEADSVEVGPVRVVGGVRPQNFDVGYRPDGVRIAFDSKTLNDRKSVGKNYQNMINDLATEATTVHSRFPSAVVGFIVVIPAPCLPAGSLTNGLVGTLTRLGGRRLVDEPLHRAEAMSLIVWSPNDGKISQTLPDPDSPLRVEHFSNDIETAYHERFQGLPPHAS